MAKAIETVDQAADYVEFCEAIDRELYDFIINSDKFQNALKEGIHRSSRKRMFTKEFPRESKDIIDELTLRISRMLSIQMDVREGWGHLQDYLVDYFKRMEELDKDDSKEFVNEIRDRIFN